MKEYLNPDTQEEKESIFSENKGKSGIYLIPGGDTGKYNKWKILYR